LCFRIRNFVFIFELRKKFVHFVTSLNILGGIVWISEPDGGFTQGGPRLIKVPELWM
jgi:hypothetical protein